MKPTLPLIVLLSFFILPNLEARTITDGLGRAVDIPERVERAICSGAGCLRLLT